MSDRGPVAPDEDDDDRRRSIFDRWGKVALVVAVLLLVGAVGVGAWALGSNNDDSTEVYVEAADSVGIDPFTTAGIAATPVAGGSSPTTTPGLYGGSGDNGVCDPAALVAFLESHHDKAVAWVGALNHDPTLSWSGGNHVAESQIGAYVSELTPTHLTADARVTNHGFAGGHPTPRQSLLKKGTAVLLDKDGVLRVRCYCGNPLTPPDGEGNAPETATTVEEATTTSAESTTTTGPSTTTTGGDVDWPDEPMDCPSIPDVPGSATDVSTAPVDFDGDGTPDVLTVYQDGGTWYVRAEIAGVGVDEDVLVGSGPTMTALGGATVNNDANEEAWVKVGSGSSTDIIGVLVYDDCELQRVELNGTPAEFPIGVTSTAADGLGCFGFDVGIEVFTSTSTDGVSYTGTSQIYTIDLNSAPPSLVLGATANQAESDPSPGFTAMSTFNCDSLNTT